VDGDLEVQTETGNFKTALYEKPIYDDATGTDVIGNALYDIQIFEDNVAAGTAEGK
jgi:hypothetical protein